MAATSSSPHIIFDGSDVPHNCVTSSSVLWQHPDDPISAATEEVVQRVKTTVVAQLCFLIGGASNCVNMAVFLKQGVHERNNMCLFTLALVDFLYLLFICFLYGENTFAFFRQVPRSVCHCGHVVLCLIYFCHFLRVFTQIASFVLFALCSCFICYHSLL